MDVECFVLVPVRIIWFPLFSAVCRVVSCNLLLSSFTITAAPFASSRGIGKLELHSARRATGSRLHVNYSTDGIIGAVALLSIQSCFRENNRLTRTRLNKDIVS
jgi:hypothetical protein